MKDLISREKALESPVKMVSEGLEWIPVYHIKELPSEEPEVKEIGYVDCSNATLKMWMDNVLTDGQYNHIMDKLNKKYGISQEDDRKMIDTSTCDCSYCQFVRRIKEGKE